MLCVLKEKKRKEKIKNTVEEKITSIYISVEVGDAQLVRPMRYTTAESNLYPVDARYLMRFLPFLFFLLQRDIFSYRYFGEFFYISELINFN